MQSALSVTHSSDYTLWEWLRGLYRFSRPESTLGSAIMSIAISLALLPGSALRTYRYLPRSLAAFFR